MRPTLLLAVMVVSLGFAPTGLADTAPLPPSVGLPWTDPNHHGPLETLVSQIASVIAGRSVAVRCYGDFDWSVITQQRGIDPSQELGYVDGEPYDGVTHLFLASATEAELSPTTCLALQQFAVATVKPTKCQPLVTQTSIEYVTKRELVKVRVRVHGKWVVKKVWREKQVPVTVVHQVPGPPTPCYLGNEHSATAEPANYWADYWNYAVAILTLAHESIHLEEIRAGVSYDSYNPTSETHANCYGLQWVPYVALQLGATPDDARAIAQYATDYIYPKYQGITAHGSLYWSADCRENGPLDLTPNDGVWP